MALNFPSSPSVNDTYSFGSRTWTWNGSAWQLNTTSAGAINGIPVGNVTPATGAFTTVTASGNITAGGILTDNYFYANGDPFVASGGGSDYTDANVKTYLASFDGNIIPAANVTYYLGSETQQWHSLYVGPGSLYVNGKKVLEDDSGKITVSTSVNQNLAIKTSGTGDIELFVDGTGVINFQSNVQIDSGVSIQGIGGVKFASNINLDQNHINNLDNPISPQDAATKFYVDTEIANLVNSAPAALDTLNELAAAMGDDPNFAATVTASIGAVASNVTILQGNVTTLEGNIVGLESDLANVNFYDDANVAAYLPTYTGNITAGNISVSGTITGYATTSYVDSELANVVASAPAGLDTLGELATAIGNDASFSTTVNASIGAVASNVTILQGNVTTLEGNITALSSSVTNVEANVTTLQGNVTTLTADLANVNYYDDANVAAYLPTYTGNITAGNILTDNYYYANGAPFVSGATVTVSNVAPSSPSSGDFWINTDVMKQLVYIDDGDTSQWVDVMAATSLEINTYGDANVAAYLPTYSGNITAGNISVSGTITGYATTSYVDSELANLVASAPAALDTLNELAAALGNDSNFSSTVTSSIGNVAANVTILQGNVTTLTAGLANVNFYDDANVAAYLPTYTGNITAGNILTDNFRYANGDPFVSSNYSDSNVATYLGNIGGNVLPAANITYDLGSDTNRWRDIYLANSTIHLGSQQISADGSGLKLPSSVSIGNVTLDTSSGNLALPAGSSIDGALVATPRISSIDYPGDDTAADPAGGQTLGIVGSGFVSGASVILDGTSLGTVTVVSSTRIEITAPAKSAGSYTLYVINSDGGTGIFIPGVQYSGLPTWSSPAAGSLGTVYETANVSATFSATSDSSVTYSLLSGDLPAGASLDSSTGVLSGTANLIAGSSVTYSFTIRATDAENQDTDRAFSLTVDADSVTWSSPADGDTISVPVDTGSTTTLSAASAAGDSITFSANALPTGLTLTGNTISGTANVVANTSVALTATADTTTRSATVTVTFSITLPVGDDYWNQTTLLINGNVSMPATTFLSDASTNDFEVSWFNEVSSSRDSPYLANWSNYFDGSGDYLTSATGSNEFIASGNGFTVEAWVYYTSISNYSFIVASTTGANNYNPYWFIGSSNTGNWRISWGDATAVDTGVAINLNTWNHVAMSMGSNGSGVLYVNGSSIATTTGKTLNSSATGVAIAHGGGSIAGSYLVTGYISNVRYVKNNFVYTSNFTPPTSPLTAISGTSLLTCQSNRLIDNSTNNFTITRNGDVKVTSFSPFADASNDLGSGSFDGVNDYLEIPAASATPLMVGTGDYTIEGWFRRRAPAAQQEQLWQMEGGPSLFWYSNNSLYYQRIPGSSTVYTAVDWVSNGFDHGWHHYAMSRESGTTRVYVDGKFVMSATATPSAGSGYFRIGNGNYGYWEGNIADFRVVIGTAVYTGGSTKGDVVFTPPTTSLTAVSGTELLILQNKVDRLNSHNPRDLSVWRHDFWPTGNPYKGAFNPASTSGWSGYFDGAAYLAVTGFPAFGTGDFTVEWWAYKNDTWSDAYDITDGGSGAFAIYTNVNGQLHVTRQSVSGAAKVLGQLGSLNPNQWYYFAIVRQSGNVRCYVDGQPLDAAVADTNSYGAPSKLFGTADGYWPGYISNFRVFTSAIYDISASSITVPTAPFEPTTDDGTAASLLLFTSPTFDDQSPNRLTINRSGYAQIASFSPFKPHTVTPDTYSVYFDGTGDYLRTPANDALAMGTEDFTLECWFYMPGSFSPAQNDSLFANDTTPGWQISWNSGGFNFMGDGSNRLLNTSTVEPNLADAWHHIAYCRTGGTLYGFLDGQSLGTSTHSSVNINFTNNIVDIGTNRGGGGYVKAYISNVRVVKGNALYTAEFTPPTSPLTAISGTSLLTCQSPTVIDNSTNAFAITVNGNSQPTRFNPFGDTVTTDITYSPASHGSSVNFNYNNPAGDQLKTPYSPAFNFHGNDFTVECWIYVKDEWPAGNYTNGTIVARSATGAGDWGIYITSTTTLDTKIQFKTATAVTVEHGFFDYLYSWVHVAWCYSAGTHRMFLNGVQVTSAAALNTYNTVSDLVIGTGSWSWISGVKITNGRAVYTSNFVPDSTPPTAEADSALLLDTSDIVILDATGRNNVEMRGAATINTAVTKYNSGSIQLIDATEPGASRLNVQAEPHLNFPGAFTFEAWVYPTDLSQTFHAILGKYGNWYWGVYGGANSGLVRMLGGGGSNVASSAAGAVVVNQWQHLAITRDNNNVTRIFVNGVQSGNNGSSSENFSNTTDLSVGSYAGNQESYDWRGYLDDIRLTRGLARYTSNFTPPTSALPGK